MEEVLQRWLNLGYLQSARCVDCTQRFMMAVKYNHYEIESITVRHPTRLVTSHKSCLYTIKCPSVTMLFDEMANASSSSSSSSADLYLWTFGHSKWRGLESGWLLHGYERQMVDKEEEYGNKVVCIGRRIQLLPLLTMM